MAGIEAWAAAFVACVQWLQSGGVSRWPLHCHGAVTGMPYARHDKPLKIQAGVCNGRGGSVDTQGLAADGLAPARSRTVIVSAAGGKPGLQSRVPLLAIGLTVLLVSVFAVLVVDAPLARFMKHSVGGDAVVLFRFLSGFGVGTGYIVIACSGLLLGALARGFDLSPFGNAELLRMQRYCLLTLLSLAASGTAVNLAKLLLGRHRPRDLFAKGQFGFESFSFHHGLDSFPSGHSQTIFVIATVLALAAPKRVRMLMGAAALVAASRVAMTNHYLSDVLVGSYIGAAAVLTIAPSILVDKASLLPPGLMSRASGFFRFQTT